MKNIVYLYGSVVNLRMEIYVMYEYGYTFKDTEIINFKGLNYLSGCYYYLN